MTIDNNYNLFKDAIYHTVGINYRGTIDSNGSNGNGSNDNGSNGGSEGNTNFENMTFYLDASRNHSWLDVSGNWTFNFQFDSTLFDKSHTNQALQTYKGNQRLSHRLVTNNIFWNI